MGRAMPDVVDRAPRRAMPIISRLRRHFIIERPFDWLRVNSMVDPPLIHPRNPRLEKI